MRSFELRRHGHVAVALVAVVILSGCDLVMGYLKGSPEKRLVKTVEDEWASPGKAFMGGLYGRDTIASVESLGDRSWRVTIPAGGSMGGEQVWEMEVQAVDVYQIFPGEAFTQFVRDSAVAADRRAALPQEAWQVLNQGGLLAVGDVKVHIRRVDRRGAADVDRIAYLRGESMRGGQWSLEPDTRGTIGLRNALRAVYDHMIMRNDKALDCMGSADPTSVPRSVQLDCVGQVLAEQFGGGSE